jgi:hypothetical protein
LAWATYIYILHESLQVVAYIGQTTTRLNTEFLNFHMEEVLIVMEGHNGF